MRTSVSQTNLILGQPVLVPGFFRDLRTVIRWLQTRKGIDGNRIGMWGDSLAKVNKKTAKLAIPLDATMPHFAEPCGGNLAALGALFEEKVKASYVAGQFENDDSLCSGPYLYIPHDGVIPGGAIYDDTLYMVVAKLSRLYFALIWAKRVDGYNRIVATELGNPVGRCELTGEAIAKMSVPARRKFTTSTAKPSRVTARGNAHRPTRARRGLFPRRCRGVHRLDFKRTSRSAPNTMRPAPRCCRR